MILKLYDFRLSQKRKAIIAVKKKLTRINLEKLVIQWSLNQRDIAYTAITCRNFHETTCYCPCVRRLQKSSVAILAVEHIRFERIALRIHVVTVVCRLHVNTE